MPFLIPLGHEYIRKRFPKFTLGLILINTVLYFVSFNVQVFQASSVATAATKLEEHESELLLKYLEEQKGEDDPYHALQSLSQKQHIQILGEFRKAMDAGKVVDRTSDAYIQWKELYDEYRESEGHLVWMRFGLRPSSFKIHALFTSMFLHGEFWHLFWNMYFLWLVGCNIEDVWGRRFFIILYLVGGAFAGLTHTLLYFRSALGDVPLVGASGAIAAVMGAFLIRYWSSKIRFLFIMWIFWVPAWVALLGWFLQQVYYGLKYMNESAGVAFWAHIGGFAFGALVAYAFQHYGIEERVIARELEKQDEKDRQRLLAREGLKRQEDRRRPEELVRGIEARKIGDYEEAREQFERAAQLYPENFDVHFELQQLYQRMGLIKEANQHQGVIVGILIEMNMIEAALERYHLLMQADPDAGIPGGGHYRMARVLEEHKEYEAAALAYRKFAAENPDDKLAPKALYQCGMILMERLKQPRSALDMFEYLLERYPGAPGEEFVRDSLEQARNRLGGWS
jgi:membrane associated rhomboid family serine protease